MFGSVSLLSPAVAETQLCLDAATLGPADPKGGGHSVKAAGVSGPEVTDVVYKMSSLAELLSDNC